MSDSVIADSSVALKWVIREEHSEQARALLSNTLLLRNVLVAPPVFLSEVTNAIYQHERRSNISSSDADVALSMFLGLPVLLRTPPDLYRDALDISRRHRLGATYDSQYLALARTLDAEFWTADARLLRALPRSFKRAHWIGDYPIGA